VKEGAVCKSASFFNSHRMMRRYVTEAYVALIAKEWKCYVLLVM